MTPRVKFERSLAFLNIMTVFICGKRNRRYEMDRKEFPLSFGQFFSIFSHLLLPKLNRKLLNQRWQQLVVLEKEIIDLIYYVHFLYFFKIKILNLILFFFLSLSLRGNNEKKSLHIFSFPRKPHKILTL